MPRSPTVFNLVPGTVPQVPDTPISSAMFNAAMLDFEQTFNTPQPIQYGGTAATTAVGGFDGLNTKGANVATAATLNLDTATGAFVDLTGTTTVTAVTLSDGRHRMARATGAFQITVGASLIGNAGGSNINVEVGDLIIFEGYSAGVVRFWLIRASGRAIVDSGFRLIQKQIAANSPALNFTDLGAYRTLDVSGILYPQNDAVSILLQISTDNGATYVTTNSYVWQSGRAQGTTVSATNGAGLVNSIQISPAGDVGNAAQEALQFSFKIHNFNAATLYPFLTGFAYQIPSDGSQLVGNIGGRWAGTTARNAFRILASSGNLASGYVIVQGEI